MRTMTAALNRLHVLTAAVLAVGCNSTPDDRVQVPSSDPQVACSQTEGPRSSRDAASGIAHAKAAIAAVYEKNHSSDLSPAQVAQFEPYTATLKDGVWHVQGTAPPGYHGYILVVSACKNDEGASITSLKVP